MYPITLYYFLWDMIIVHAALYQIITVHYVFNAADERIEWAVVGTFVCQCLRCDVEQTFWSYQFNSLLRLTTNKPSKLNITGCFVRGIRRWVPGVFPLQSASNVESHRNWNIFRVTGPLCGEFTGHRWIPRTKASDAELWCFSLIYV